MFYFKDEFRSPQIAKVQKINVLNPDVLAIDMNFPEHRCGYGDLVFALDHSKNLVISSVIRNFNGDKIDAAGLMSWPSIKGQAKLKGPA